MAPASSRMTRPGPWQVTHHMTIEMGNRCGKPGGGNERASSDWAQVDCTDCLALKPPVSWRPALVVFELMELEEAGALGGIRAIIAERLRQVRAGEPLPEPPWLLLGRVHGMTGQQHAESAALLAAEIDRQETGRGDGDGQ